LPTQPRHVLVEVLIKRGRMMLARASPGDPTRAVADLGRALGLATERPGDHRLEADARAELARALLAQRPPGRDEARAMAQAARDAFVAMGRNDRAAEMSILDTAAAGATP